jgi:S-adenosylmethionine:tRNA-ribosyltransferase-isomerase (queuine synthetase)
MLAILLLSPCLLQGQQATVGKRIPKKISSYSFNKLDWGHYSDSSWLEAETFGTRNGNNILTITYEANGNIKSVIVRDMDSLHRVLAYKIFNNQGIITHELKREKSDDGSWITIVSNAENVEKECKWNKLCNCKYNKEGDVIYFEKRSENDSTATLIKLKCVYEYW